MKGYVAIDGGLSKACFTIKRREYDELLTKLAEYSGGTKLVLDLSREEATKLYLFMLAVEKTEPENIEKDSKVFKVEL